MGRLLGIATRAKTKEPMARPSRARITAEAGVDGDFRGKPGDRQVVVLAREGFEAACRELGATLPWTLRRANLYLEGVDLRGTTGARLLVGEVELEITGECDPCQVMDWQHAGLRKALTPDWRAGVTCRVVRGGEIAVGDEVVLSRERGR